FQYAALFDSMTAADNIAFPLREHTDRSEADIAATVEDLLRRVQLEGRGDRMPSELSGGMRKRVGIARSLALEPDILYFDEPTSGLDPVTAAVIEDLIMETHRDFGYTGLVITHHWELAQRLASRVALLWRGRIHAIGTPGEFEASHDPIIRGFLDRDPRVLNLPTGPDGQRA
ncbi:MAG: ATP-binding cassette domain-containing protein, partial [Candidatus Dadabacteria bacterium]